MELCPLCKNDKSKTFPIFYIFNRKKFEGRKCLNCGFIFIAPRPTDEELSLLYSDEYFLYDGSDFGAHSSTDYEKAAINGSVKFPVILGEIQKYKNSGKFFEIGCGMGYFLNYAKNAGFDVYGVEYSELGVKKCKDKFNINVERSSFEKYRNQLDMYDVVFMGDVLEHLTTPLEMLVKTRQMLKLSGIIAVEVPSTFNSLVGKMAVFALKISGRKRKMPMPPYHINEFTPDTLKKILEKAGFRHIYIHQRIKSPKSITLRGNLIEKMIKMVLQYPNYFITKLSGVFGDRLLAIGIKEKDS